MNPYRDPVRIAEATSTMRCPRCGHEADPGCDPATTVLQCSECHARIAYGLLLPDIRIEPDAQDRRFVRMRFGELEDFKLDKNYAWRLAIELLSICPPPV